MQSILRTAVEAALAAGEEIMQVYDSDFSVEYKTDESPLTRADENAHRVITAILSPPGIPVLSEEGKSIPFEERKNWSELFVVDPLDGTKEFVKRNGEFTVNIALVRNGKPVLGVIYVPVMRTLYYGAEGIGAFKIPQVDDREKLIGDWEKRTELMLPAQALPEVCTIVGSRSHASPETEAYIKDMQKQHGEVNFAASGSSLKFCLLAEGKAHYYPRFAPTMEWDTAAGQAILEAAGGKVFVHPGNAPLRYNREELRNPWFLASAPGL
ncbi:MAG: 3'(2'),5'-bisphosphate nucleotidase [Bacteroidetes bacterium]|nr:MAG: 3'(2'),5'-bisphosphate nucleotidase [Bacteroidota bacterium]